MHQSTSLAPPDLDHLRAFVHVAQTLSFTTAARALELDASVVARRIAALERRLGVRLVERTTRRMMLTEAGQAYLLRVQPALEELAAVEAETRERGHRPAGLLRASLPATFGRLWIAPLLPAFLAKHPDIDLDLRFADRYVDLVAERFDVAVRLGVLAESGLVARKIRDYARGVFAAPAYLKRHGTPERPDDLAEHCGLSFAGFDRPSQWTLSRGHRQRVVDVPLRMVSDDSSVLIAAAAAGAGVVVATDWLVHAEVLAGKLMRVLPEWTVGAPGAAYLVMPSMRFVPGKTRAFADWIVEALRALPPWGRRSRRDPSPSRSPR